MSKSDGFDLTLCFFRHGETDWNLARRLQGHLDIPLNATGQAQAEALAERLERLAPRFAMRRVYSSDLKRARATAEAVASRLGLKVSTTPELREADMGEAQGKTRDELADEVGREFLELWFGDPFDARARALRFEGGESRAEMVWRVEALIEHWKKVHPGEIIGVSSHGGVLRHVLGRLTPHAHRAFQRVPNTALFVVGWDGEVWTLLHSPLDEEESSSLP